MSCLRIVVERLSDWDVLPPSPDVVTVEQYIAERPTTDLLRVINLCPTGSERSSGVYCSSLAEARGHRVIPPLASLIESSHVGLAKVPPEAQSSLSNYAGNNTFCRVIVSFGRCEILALNPLMRSIFESCRYPLMLVRFDTRDQWEMTLIEPAHFSELNIAEKQAFEKALIAFQSMPADNKNGVKHKIKLAVLTRSSDPWRLSSQSAINKFIDAAEMQGIHAEIISDEDFSRLEEFDALFLRASGSVAQRFVRRAKMLGMVTLDDTLSMLRCTNKICLAQLFEKHKISTPKSLIFGRSDASKVDLIISNLGLPLVLRIPYGNDVSDWKKASSKEQLVEFAKVLFEKSEFLLAQSYLYAEHEWKIGMLDSQALFAGRYSSAKNRWQQTGRSDFPRSAEDFESVAIAEIPKPVLRAAANAVNAVGAGFFCVDVRQSGNCAYLFDVNYGPTIDLGVEDNYQGGFLYEAIMQEFKTRLES